MRQFIFSVASFLSDNDEGYLTRKLVSTLAGIASFDSWMLVHFKSGHKPEIMSCRDNLRSSEAYAETYFRDDPFFAAIEDGFPSEFMTLDSIEPRFFRQSTYFQNYLETESGFSDQVAYICSVDREETCMLVLGRSGKFKPFRACEKLEFRQAAQIVRAVLMLIWVKKQSCQKAAASNPDKEKQTQADLIMHDFGAIALSPREKEILRLLLAGESAKSMGRELQISPGTAQSHIKNIYLKLGVSSRGELFGRFVDELLENNVA